MEKIIAKWTKKVFNQGGAFMRKAFLLLAALFLVAILTPCSAVHAKKILKLQALYPTSMPIVGEVPGWVAKQIKEATGGEILIKVYDPGKLVSGGEILDAVSTGRIEMGYSSAGFWQGKMPAASLFSAVPFGPEAPEYMAWFFYGNGMKLYQEMYDQAGYKVKAFPVCLNPPETSGWFKKEIKTLDDLKGLKMRFFGLGGAAMQKLGVATNQLSPAEIFPSLEKGVIDATEFSTPVVDRSFGFYKIAKFNYFPGWHQMSTVNELLINKNTWNNLKPSERKVIELTMMASLINTLAEGEALQAPVMKENVEKFGVKNKYWSDEFLKAFHEAWLEVVEEQTAKNAYFKKVWEDLEAFRKDYATWVSYGYLPRRPPAKD